MKSHEKVALRLFTMIIILQCLKSSCINPFIYRRDLLIFLDWTQEHIGKTLTGNLFGAITNNLAEALYHETAPIICSSTLWLNIIQQAQFTEDLLSFNIDAVLIKRLETIQDYGLQPKDLFLPNTREAVKEFMEFIQLANDIYQKINKDIKSFEEKGLNEYEALDLMLNNEHEYLSEDKIQVIERIGFGWNIIKSLLLSKIIVDKTKSRPWKIYSVSRNLFLLVPQAYLGSKKVWVSQMGVKVVEDASFSQDALVLGLKIDTMSFIKEPYKLPELSAQILGAGPWPRTIQEMQTKIDQTSRDFADNLDKIFIKHDEVQKTPGAILWDVNKITWSIFADGHGVSDKLGEFSMIINLRDNDFAQFLDFLNTQIKTNFFFYTTCFAAGHRLRTQYEKFTQPYTKTILTKEMKQKEVTVIPKPLTFPIAVGAITHAATCSTTPELFIPPLSVDLKRTWAKVEKTIEPAQREAHKKIVLEQRKKAFASVINLNEGVLEPAFGTDFGGFFYLLNQSKNSYAAILDLAVNIYEKLAGTDALKVGNIPHIRFPDSPWFSVVDLAKDAAKLTLTTINVHEAENRPIYAKDKKVMLLYAHQEFNIPVGPAHSEIMIPLIIRGERMPAVVSLVAGDAEHYLEQVDARDMLISDVLSKFAGSGIYYMAYARTFYIKKLICKNVLNSIAKNKLSADDKPILEFNDVIINQDSYTAIAGKIVTPVTITFSYKAKRFVINATFEGIRRPEGLERGLQDILQAFWADPKIPESWVFKIPLIGRPLAEWRTEVKMILDAFVKETTEKPKPYPHLLKKVFPLREVAKAEKARAQFPALIKHYEKIQNDPEKVAKWLKTLNPGQRAAMQDYIQYARRTAQGATQELQRSLMDLSISLTALNKALTT